MKRRVIFILSLVQFGVISDGRRNEEQDGDAMIFGHTSPVARRDTAFLSALKKTADAGELHSCGLTTQTGRDRIPRSRSTMSRSYADSSQGETVAA